MAINNVVHIGINHACGHIGITSAMQTFATFDSEINFIKKVDDLLTAVCVVK
jgi:hypothetical protein